MPKRKVSSLQQDLAENADVVSFDPHESAERADVVGLYNLKGKPFIVAMSPDESHSKGPREGFESSADFV